ncbi:MAG TPA: (d)CMP kinase [Bacteroidota bacterium]
MKRITIAIDGPAASGKSTTAELVARKLGYVHLDTGAMYRAITFGILQKGISASAKKEVQEFAQKANLVVRPDERHSNIIILNGVNVTVEIRSPEVTRNVSTVSSYEAVRSVLVREQRKLAEHGGIVLEGRDIGTVVLPDADLKIFMVASVTERARRRKKDLLTVGIEVEDEEVAREIEERDRKDSTREVSPLRMAEDAIKLDTSDLTIDEQVDFIVERARRVISGGGDK